jgi:tRNA(fMet)-specific endonuclease VapC
LGSIEMFCLDTNILIHILNKSFPVLNDRLQLELTSQSHVLIPSIVRFELEYGYEKGSRTAENRVRLKRLLKANFDLIDFDHQDGVEAGQIRAELEKAGTPIGPYDVLIAAQARRRGAVLVTLNTREFMRIPGLMVTDWGAEVS